MASISMKRLAIAIGIDDYLPPQTRLSGCVGDAQRLVHFLGSARGGSFDTVLLLKNRDAHLGRLRELFSRASVGSWDQVVVYFSGHGSHNGILTWNGLMEFEELASWIRGIPAKWHLLILDACQAGAVHHYLDGIVGGIPLEDSASIYLALLRQAHPGLRVLTSVDRYTNALERNAQGVFTTALLRAARLARPDLDQQGVSAERLLSVATEILRHDSDPLPMGSGYLSDLPMALTDALVPLGGAGVYQAPLRLAALSGGPLSAYFDFTVRVKGRKWVPTFIQHEVRDGFGTVHSHSSEQLRPATNDETQDYCSREPVRTLPIGRSFQSIVTVLDERKRPMESAWVNHPPIQRIRRLTPRTVQVLPPR